MNGVVISPPDKRQIAKVSGNSGRQHIQLVPDGKSISGKEMHSGIDII